MLTALLASAVPLSVGCVSLVDCPLPMAPVLFGTSSTMLVISGTVGARVSTTIVKPLVAGLTLPAGSVAVTVNMRVPSFNPVVGVKLHAPPALAEVTPSRVLPS
ncbi:Uncharacterised protein [Salmonella enterica subsp. enterica serovar Bovismorbificans]|nr:Uncharacterised protein [Salmonella enterica subsp. enterica serovar Bovismorbificans]CNV19241.1 Uncharacterised protein [Salmonella enterica subsp. enterica serovar Bovismorbificans]CNV19406.1 Uncharacterised protein [Salmonella enterica subsp. enterica serovar Bovismorbificans]CQB65566.1 Uncharacterised protein [Salmonella enterica subsp. enterica serovar Bovismorbificans]